MKKFNQNGLIMPFVIGFLVILTTIGVTLTRISSQSFNSSRNFSYNQIAHIASKAAIDYAEEQFNNDESYSGTPEQDLYIGTTYRSTIEVEKIDQSNTGGGNEHDGAHAGAHEKNHDNEVLRIRAIGRVYVKNATNPTAGFIREIQSTIVRDGAENQNPFDDEPFLWLDANAPDTLFSSASSAPTTVTVDGLYGSGNADVVEERGTDASKSPGKLQYNADLEMSYDGAKKGHQEIGLRFRNVTVNPGEVIDSAYIQFTTDETKSSGNVSLLVEGVALDNPTSWSGNSAVSNSPSTTTSITWAPNDWNNVGVSGNDERVNITGIVQELINRSGWANGNSMAFKISYINGSGVRTAEAGKDGNPAPQLQINWGGAGGGSSGVALNDGDSVGQWLDISGNNNHADLAFGVDAILKKSVINGLDAVRFTSNNVFKSIIDGGINGHKLSAFAVMLPRAATQADGRFVSALDSAQSSDMGNQDSAIMFMRFGSGNSLIQHYNNGYGQSLSNAVDNSWSVYSSTISDSKNERLLENGIENAFDSITSIDYNIDQAFVGGTRSGSVAAFQSDFDLAELVMYDGSMVCSQVQTVEDYLGAKYNIPITTKVCP